MKIVGNAQCYSCITTDIRITFYWFTYFVAVNHTASMHTHSLISLHAAKYFDVKVFEIFHENFTKYFRPKKFQGNFTTLNRQA